MALHESNGRGAALVGKINRAAAAPRPSHLRLVSFSGANQGHHSNIASCSRLRRPRVRRHAPLLDLPTGGTTMWSANMVSSQATTQAGERLLRCLEPTDARGSDSCDASTPAPTHVRRGSRIGPNASTLTSRCGRPTERQYGALVSGMGKSRRRGPRTARWNVKGDATSKWDGLGRPVRHFQTPEHLDLVGSLATPHRRRHEEAQCLSAYPDNGYDFILFGKVL